MKRLIIAVLIAMLLIPGIVSAQEIPPPQPSWQVKPERSIIFIGEDLIVMVNGTGNTSYTLEMRRLDANGTILNATFTYRGLTDANGTQWAVVPDGYNEEPGSYRVQVLLNQIVVTYADVRLDYSFERWVEIQLTKSEERDAEQDEAIQVGVSRDAAMWDSIIDCIKQNNFQWGVLLGMMFGLMPIFLGAYKERCVTKRKRSRLVEALEGVEEDRRIYYGGAITTPIEVRMYGGANSCKKRSDKDHKAEACPHCALDQWATEMGLAGMTHQQIVEYIGGGKKADKPKVERPTYFERVALWREYTKLKKDRKKKSDDKKVKP